MEIFSVYLTKDDVLTGEFWIFDTEEKAKKKVDDMRNARDNDPVWSLFKKGNYDWKIVEWNEEEQRPIFVY